MAAIEIEGFPIAYELPEQPPIKEISGNHLPKKDQKWIREILPSDKEAALLTKEERLQIQKQELTRRVLGFWFMNNGEPTYITGAHYFYLTHWFFAALTKDGYGVYMEAQRDWFYVIDICVKDPNCYGAIMMCQKRFGKSEMALAELYNAATLLDTDCLFGMNSLSATEAKNNLFKSRIMRSHKRIPNYLKPVSNESKGTKEIVSELTFLGEKVDGGVYKGGLNNVIDWRPTIPSAYQGKRPKRVFFDEPPSVEEMDLMEWWTTVREQLAQGTDVIFGRAFLPATLETMDKKGAPKFQEIWEGSDYNQRDANGRTRSGLYRYLKPYYKGREGCVDEYGKDDIEKAKKFRQNQLENATPEGAVKIRNQYPENERDAFGLAGVHSPFDVQKIKDQMEFNKLNPQVLKTGNFYWLKERFGKVGWMPHPEGRYTCTWFPDDNLRNNQKIVNGKVAPANELNGGFGLDSFSARSTVGKNGSNCALYGILTPSMNREYPFFFLEYLHRAATPELQSEDVLMACIFYGMPVLGERNTLTVFNFFYQMGFENYLQDRPRDVWEIVPQAQKREKWLPNVSDEQRTSLVAYTMSYIQQYVGINDATGKMGECYFNKLLQCWLDFDPTSRWQPYDSFVGAAYSLTAINRPKIQRQQVSYIPPIPKYDNKGMRSVLIK